MLDLSRSIGLFDPHKFKGDIHVIGAGATGGRVVEGLVKLGVPGIKLYVYDFDVIEEHNIPNQVFSLSQVGQLKTEALRDNIKEKYGEDINIITEPATKDTYLSGIVFMLPDTFKAREDIFNGIAMKPSVKAMIETRLDARMGIVHTINPCDVNQVDYFKQSFFEDDDKGVEVSACGTAITIAHTVDVVSGVALWEFVKFINNNRIGRRITISLDPILSFDDDISKLYNKLSM